MADRLPADILARARREPCLAIAAEAGVRLKSVATGEHAGPCPVCGGRDRFSINSDANVWNCRGCGRGGDAIDLWQHCHGGGFLAAIEALARWSADVASGEAGKAERPSGPSASARDGEAVAQVEPQEMAGSPPAANGGDAAGENPFRRKAQKRAYDLWRQGRPAGDLIAGYFARRSILFPDWPLRTVRQIDRLAYWHEGEVIFAGPAMLAAITGPDGKFIGVHRTWLDPDQPTGKAAITDPKTGEVLDAKKVLGSQRGGAIVLRGETGPDWPEPFAGVIGEGIETVLSFDALHGAGEALWCSINLDNMAGRAIGRIAHPTLRRQDRLGRLRTVKLPSDVPDMGDEKCLALPDAMVSALFLGDGDSDPFRTRAAMRRALARHGTGGRTVRQAFAPAGMDWNDELRARAHKADGPPAIGDSAAGERHKETLA